MNPEEQQYAGLEPTDNYTPSLDALDDLDFDSSEYTSTLFTVPEFLEPPAFPAGGIPTSEPAAYVPPAPIVGSTPVLPEPVPAAPLQFIDPRVLNPGGNVIDNTVQGDAYNMNYPPMDYPTMNYPTNNSLTAFPNPFPAEIPGYPSDPIQYPYPELKLPQPRAQNRPQLNYTNTPDSGDTGYSDVKSNQMIPIRRSKIPSPKLIYRGPPLKRPDKGPNGESLRNGQIPRVTRKKDAKPNPREWYGPPLPPPESWGPRDKNGRHLFKYTECGELERGKTYTISEIRRYLYGPKLGEPFLAPEVPEYVPLVEGKVRQGLTLWIGWVAPQSNERYPFGAQSQRCRFENCIDEKNTIRTGFPRIIFDERMNEDGEAIDVFYNAGYVHLFCFERHFDLVEAICHIDIRPDERNFKREENLNKLSRHYPEIQNEVDEWWNEQYNMYIDARARGQKRDRNYKNSLSYRLINYALEHSPDTRVKMRESRGGVDLSKHRGDLLLQRFLKDCKANGLMNDDGRLAGDAQEQLADRIRKKGKGNKSEAAETDSQDLPVQVEQRPPGDPGGSLPYHAGLASMPYGSSPDPYMMAQRMVQPAVQPMAQPLVQPYVHNYPPQLVAGFNQPAMPPYYQPTTENPTLKRDRDVALHEDKAIEKQRQNSPEEPSEENSTKKRRQESPKPHDRTPSAGNRPTLDAANQQAHAVNEPREPSNAKADTQVGTLPSSSGVPISNPGKELDRGSIAYIVLPNDEAEPGPEPAKVQEGSGLGETNEASDDDDDDLFGDALSYIGDSEHLDIEELDVQQVDIDAEIAALEAEATKEPED